MSRFVEIKPEDIRDNVFKLIGSDWMLITAGTRDFFNMMTASWGGLGVLWGNLLPARRLPARGSLRALPAMTCHQESPWSSTR